MQRISGSLWRWWSGLLLCLTLSAVAQADSVLPSWRDRTARTAIIAFVQATTTQGSPDFVPPAERIAVFDNDGTLWSEQPLYFQGAFAFDRIKAMAPDHPEWASKELFASVLKGDYKTALAGGEKALGQIILTTHAGMTSDQFNAIVADWLRTAKHPRFKRPYNELVYQPMLEVLGYLRANGYKTFIVSGGGAEFMRVFAEQTYGVPPEQVIGSTIKTHFELRDGKAVIVRDPDIDSIDDGPGKPVGIARYIGRAPIIAFGNSDGDLQMLQYTTQSSSKKRLGVIIHHTDADREFAYDRKSINGKLDKALDLAQSSGWIVVDMKNDWSRIYPFEQ
ncbi:HAD family hydrolase [Amantichitinum ursilacus]|uniref:phosphoserine phosphatase n=1 Tax=Amantichitinum ursilacus TaxID=857265 RepID=A0A0N1JTY6_9NEIS|nr:HAD family hydrolase [Amantichitinum ursilacus]KPC55354.1 haloacid dehalogenase-like hydrolase [Amantichitinum ursilacus]